MKPGDLYTESIDSVQCGLKCRVVNMIILLENGSDVTAVRFSSATDDIKIVSGQACLGILAWRTIKKHEI